MYNIQCSYKTIAITWFLDGSAIFLFTMHVMSNTILTHVVFSVTPTDCQYNSIRQHKLLLYVKIKIYIITFRVAYHDMSDGSLAFQYARRDTLEHTNGNCHLCILWSTCRPWCNTCIRLINKLNMLMPKYQLANLNAQWHEGTIMATLLIINVTYLAYASKQGK